MRCVIRARRSRALARTGDNGYRALLRTSLPDPSASVRSLAAYATRALGLDPPDSWCEVLDHGSAPDTHYALHGLGRLRPNTTPTPKTRVMAYWHGDASAYGHFGRKPKEVTYTDSAGKQHTATAFSWEKTDKADELRKGAGLK